MKSQRVILAVLLAAVLASIVVGCSRGKEGATPTSGELPAITLKLALEGPEKHSPTIFAREFANRVAQATDGRVKIELYPGGVLSKGFSLWTDTARGLVDMAVGYDYVLNIVDPGLFSGGLVYLFDSREQGAEFARHPEGGQKLLGMLEKHGGKGIGIFPGTLSLLTVANREIKSWHDLKGVRSQGLGGDVGATYGKITKTQMVFIPAIDVYTPLAQGLIDAAHSSPYAAWNTRLYEVAKYGYLWNFSVNFVLIWMDLDAWNRLPATYQEIMLQTAEDMVPWALQLVEDMDKEALDNLSKVMTLHRESEEDRAEMERLWTAALREKGYYDAYDPEILAVAREIAGKPDYGR